MDFLVLLLFLMYVYFYQVFDGDNANFPLVGTFCGNSIPSYFVSTGNLLTIQFVTDSSVQRRGFNATYRAVPSMTFPTLSHTHAQFCYSETVNIVRKIAPFENMKHICFIATMCVLYGYYLKRHWHVVLTTTLSDPITSSLESQLVIGSHFCAIQYIPINT